MPANPINLKEKLGLFDDRWSPKVIAAMNDYQIKLAKLEGPFVWHNHQDTDELFLVLEGRLCINFRDRDVHLESGDMIVVPKGVDHRPFAQKPCSVLLIEPQGVVNTGEAASDLTAPNDVWI